MKVQIPKGNVVVDGPQIVAALVIKAVVVLRICRRLVLLSVRPHVKYLGVFVRVCVRERVSERE